MGLADDEEQKIEDPRSALHGIVTVRKVETTGLREYRDYRKRRLIKHQSIRGDFLYFAVETPWFVPFADGAEAAVLVTERFRLNRPGGLVEGELAIRKEGVAPGAPNSATLEKLPHGWLREHFGEKRILHLNVPETPYSLLVIDGAVTPLIAVSDPRELWKVAGLEDFCKDVDAVQVEGESVTLITWGGDMRAVLSLDFKKGPSISYKEEYDGP
jgi:hypothetical protein